MIKLEKSKLEPTLLTISSYSAPKEGEVQKMVSGLLMETLTLGTKRRLQKIHKEAQKAYSQLIEDAKEVNKECGEDKERLKNELEELLKETVEIDAEPILMSFIENISTTNNYDFDIIEKIAI